MTNRITERVALGMALASGIAGAAASDVTISGYGRTGVIYYESGMPNENETQIVGRLRLNIDASTSTDHDLDFGARLRVQWDQGSSTRGDAAATNAGKLWVSSNGFTIEVGNIDTAFHSTGLRSAPQLGAFDRSVGFNDLVKGFFAYDSDSYALADYVGVGLTYSVDDLTVRASYVDPSQSGENEGDGFAEEFGMSVDYTWQDRLELSAGYVMDGAGIKDNDQVLLGARYAVMDNARIGMNYYSTEDWVTGDTMALYGDYSLADGLTNLEAYAARNDSDWSGKETDYAFGIGVNHDLGGVRLGASLQRDYDERVSADMGVRFDF